MGDRLQAAFGGMWSRQAEFATPYVEAFETLTAKRDDLLEYVTAIAQNPADLDDTVIEEKNLNLQHAFKAIVYLSVEDCIPSDHGDLEE